MFESNVCRFCLLWNCVKCINFNEEVRLSKMSTTYHSGIVNFRIFFPYILQYTCILSTDVTIKMAECNESVPTNVFFFLFFCFLVFVFCFCFYFFVFLFLFFVFVFIFLFFCFFVFVFVFVFIFLFFFIFLCNRKQPFMPKEKTVSSIFAQEMQPHQMTKTVRKERKTLCTFFTCTTYSWVTFIAVSVLRNKLKLME